MVVTVDGDVTVGFDGVRLVTGSVLLDLSTVSSCSTCIVYCLLKHLLVTVFAHTISRIFLKFPPNRKIKIIRTKPRSKSDFEVSHLLDLYKRSHN